MNKLLPSSTHEDGETPLDETEIGKYEILIIRRVFRQQTANCNAPVFDFRRREEVF